MDPVEQEDEGSGPDGESKRQRFQRLAVLRTRNVIHRLRILGNCANRGAYEYDDGDVHKIFGAIQAELDEARRRFERGKKRQPFDL